MDRRLLIGRIGLLALAPLLAVSAAGPARAAGKGEKAAAGGTTYVPLPAVLGVTRRADGRRGVLSVECGLDVPDAALRERAEASLPRLRSAFMSTVQTYAAGLPVGAPPNVDFIARALQQQTDAVLGRRGARLLLGAVVVN
jgi:Flagellar basal body-associated protein